MAGEIDHVAVVRKRAGMYVGEPAGEGALNMLLRVLDNSVAQYDAGRCTRIEVKVERDGAFAVADDGPGVAADGAGGDSDVVAQLTCTSRPGLFVVGLVAVCALSSEMVVVSVRAGVEVRATFATGRMVAAVETRPAVGPTGTTVTVRPDRSLVTGRLSRARLMARLDDLAHLHPGLRIGVRCEPDEHAAEGLVGLVRQTCADLVVTHHRGGFGTEEMPVEVEVAVAWRHRVERPVIHGFANERRTSYMRSDQVRGLFDGIRAARGLDRAESSRGLVAAISVVLDSVNFRGPAFACLESADARRAAAAATRLALENTPACVPPPIGPP